MTGLKLRDDAYYAPTGDGVYILTPQGEVVMTGSSIFDWVDRLAPFLDGRHTLAELTKGLDGDHRRMAERVITALRDRGVVVETTDDANGAPDDRRAYQREIGFLGYFGPSGARSFQAYRDGVALLVGAGRLLAEAAQAAMSSGSRRLHVAVTDDDTTALAKVEPRDPQQQITCTTADPRRLFDLVGAADVVVYTADQPLFDDVRALDVMCSQAGVPFVSAILAGDHAWLGPFGPSTSWMGAWGRIRGMRDVAPDPSAATGTSTATVVANQLIREVVRLLSGTTPTGPARMTRIDLRSLRTESHTFLPHPFSLTANRQDRGDLAAAVARLEDGDPLDPEEFSRQMTACLEPRLGVLSEVTEQDFVQIPLAVAQVRVSDPALLLDPDAPLPVVTGAGLSMAQARRAAVLRGLAVYGSLMVDPRRLHVPAGDRGPSGDQGEDLAALRGGRWNALVWGHGLADRRPHLVAAELAFPALRGVRRDYLPPPGAAAGFDWRSAVRSGLIGQCRRLTLAELGDGRRRFRRVEWDEVAMDASGSRYRSIAKVMSGSLEVYDVTGAAQMPTLGFCLGGVAVAYASGFSFDEALRDGLADVILAYQARSDGDADYAPDCVPSLPERTRLAGVTACPDWSTDPANVAARLAQLGWNAVAVPLDHDPGILPALVNVVVTHD